MRIHHFSKFVILEGKNEPIILRPADWPTRTRENVSDRFESSALIMNFINRFSSYVLKNIL